MRKRAAAIVEVLLAFAFVHMAYRSLKQFTALGRWEGAAGLNFTPGLVMILFTVSVLLLCRRSFEVYGLTLKRWRYNLNVGLLWVVLAVALAGLGLMLTRVHFDPAHPHNDMAGRLAGAIFGLIMTILLVWMFKRQRTFLDRIPLAVDLLLVIALLSVPVVVAAYDHRHLLKALLSVGWLFLGAGFGEEIFFRGYIQTRVDEAFGRPFRSLGLDFGLGLCMSSLLFGFLHALNTVDYFHGHFDFAWWYGVQSCFTGLFYGCLRQKTGASWQEGLPMVSRMCWRVFPIDSKKSRVIEAMQLRVVAEGVFTTGANGDGCAKVLRLQRVVALAVTRGGSSWRYLKKKKSQRYPRPRRGSTRSPAVCG